MTSDAKGEGWKGESRLTYEHPHEFVVSVRCKFLKLSPNCRFNEASSLPLPLQRSFRSRCCSSSSSFLHCYVLSTVLCSVQSLLPLQMRCLWMFQYWHCSTSFLRASQLGNGHLLSGSALLTCSPAYLLPAYKCLPTSNTSASLLICLPPSSCHVPVLPCW